jgi:hypothetical protein
MKIAAIKLGARIADSGTSGGSGEALAILKMLSRDNDVHVYSKSLKKDKPIDFVTYHEILDEYKNVNKEGYDALIVINGSVNFFGGTESPEQILNYNVIQNFKGEVFYILCDPNLLLTQIWNAVKGKEWSSNYNEKDIFITRDVTYITQPRNFEPIKKKTDKIGIPVKQFLHYPFEKFPLLAEQPKWLSLEERQYDILYGGTFRGGRREDDMIKFFFDYPENINTTLFGNIKESNFCVKKTDKLKHPKYEKAVDYSDFNDKMSTALSTIIIGDKFYKETDDLTQRIYESILSGVVTFIDSSFDPNKRVFSGDLADFLYVNNKDDVLVRLDILKNMKEDDFQNLLKRQLNNVSTDINQYCSNFSKMIGDLK